MASIFGNDKAKLIKKGKNLDIEIISGETISGSQSFKSSIHQNIGNGDNYEFMGIGEARLQIKLYLATKEDYNKLIDFLKDGTSFLLSAADLWDENLSVNLDGLITTENYYKGWCLAVLNITTARNVNDTIDSQIDRLGYRNTLKEITKGVSTAKTFYEKMFAFGKSTFSFVENTNQKIGGTTNAIAVYGSAITNITQGLASASTIATNPISSVKNSIAQVIGGVSGMITSWQNAVAAIKQLPSDIEGFIDSISAIGDQLNNLFNFDNPNDTLRYNTTLLQDVALAIIDPDLTSDNPAIKERAPDVTTDQGATSAAEFFLTTIESGNSDGLSVMLLGSILITLYQNANKIDKWNKTDLDRLKITTERIYSFITTKDLTFDFYLQLDLARNDFFELFKLLYERAIKTIIVKIETPRFLSDIVYSVNGNLDYYNETKQLNGIIGTTVEEDIEVIRND